MDKLSLKRFSILTLIIFFCSCNNEKKSDVEENPSLMLFTSIEPSVSGINFTNKVNATADRNSLFYDYFFNGSGVAIGDINNDGLADIFFTGNDAENKLYLNQSGFKFEDITEKSLPSTSGWCTGVNMVDLNQDGFLDIFICRSGMDSEEKNLSNQLLINNGDLTFTDATEGYGLADINLSIHSSFFDYDKDGDLDLWLNNHLNYNGDLIALFENEDKSHSERKKFRSCLYENIGNKFIDVSQKSGVSRESASLGVVTADFNGDGWIDIYVSNDYDIPDYYFQNNGDKTFTEVSKSKIGHTSFYSMGIDAADINNDQLLDMVAVDMTPKDHVRNKVLMASMDSKKFQFLYDFKGLTKSYMVNTVQMGVGDGNFSEVGNFLGVSQTEWSWAPLIADFDNDGLKDLYITNGYLKDTKDNDFKQKISAFQLANGGIWNEEVYAYAQKILNSTPIDNKVFQNKDGKFKDVTSLWSTIGPTFSNGAAYGDLDNDGDLDLVINNIDQQATILRNDVKGANYVKVKLIGETPNELVSNAEVYLHCDNIRQRCDYYFSRGYQSSVEHILHFGLGANSKVDKIVVIWPDGKEEAYENIEVNELNSLKKGIGITYLEEKSEVVGSLFTDVTAQLQGTPVMHSELKFDDFKKEILLPHKYSDLGPALAAGDVNGDGFDDLFLGGSNISEPQILINTGSAFIAMNDVVITNDKKFEDLGALFFDYNNDGFNDLYIASGGGGEIENYPELTQDRLYKNDGNGNFINQTDVLPPITSSTMAIVAFDADNDGDQDLLIGGRNTPGKYPVDAKSYFLENTNGIFRDRTQRKLSDLPGMITDIETTDLNNDGWVDLVIVGEWSSPVIYINKEGEFEKTAIIGLPNNSGWWQSIQKADLDNDGDMDFILGNMGENTKFHPSLKKPLGILASDFDNSGSLDIVLTKKYNDKTVPVRGKECSSQQMPMLNEKFDTYEGFATSSIEEILGEDNIKDAYSRSVSDFSSYVLINKGNLDFSVQKLPNEAQWFPIMDILVSDYNSDGYKDVFLVGNKINAEPETPSYDAGRGLLLMGDGKLNFSPVTSIVDTGINAKHDARAVKSIKMKNGKEILVIANNNGPLQMYSLDK